MDLIAYISEERPLVELLELLNSPGTSVFFDAEDEVLHALPVNRHSAERILEYLNDFDSVTAWEILIAKYWDLLTSTEQLEMRKKRIFIWKAKWWIHGLFLSSKIVTISPKKIKPYVSAKG